MAGLGSRWSTLRTTQFHEFAQQTVERGTTLGLFIAPTMRTQPIAASAVASELVTIAVSGPQGLVADLAGPREEFMPDLVRRYAQATGNKNPVVRLTLPGSIGKAMRDGRLLPTPGTRLDNETFDEWLRTRQK